MWRGGTSQRRQVQNDGRKDLAASACDARRLTPRRHDADAPLQRRRAGTPVNAEAMPTVPQHATLRGAPKAGTHRPQQSPQRLMRQTISTPPRRGRNQSQLGPSPGDAGLPTAFAPPVPYWPEHDDSQGAQVPSPDDTMDDDIGNPTPTEPGRPPSSPPHRHNSKPTPPTPTSSTRSRDYTPIRAGGWTALRGLTRAEP